MTALALAVNAGSSSLKFGLYAAQGPARWSGQFEGLEPGGTPGWRFRGEHGVLPIDGHPFGAALTQLQAWLAEEGVPLAAVAHRIVHGGTRCTAPCVLDEATLAYLHGLNPLAPLHQPANLAGVAALRRVLPQVPQVGCFDTAFHAGLPATETRLPLPQALADEGLRRYGFHGLSYQYVSQTLAALTPRAQGRLVMAHLGNGASVCAAVAGRSVATSMGFSALDGLMMGTRSGSIDPGVLLHLWRLGWTREAVERLLYTQSGLKGVSGISADMRVLRHSPEPAAREAIALFDHRLTREVGAMLALLEGADVLAFTGGIGEHDAGLRQRLCARLAWAGVQIDDAANAAAAADGPVAIHAPGSAVAVWVVPTDEGQVAAQSALALIGPL